MEQKELLSHLETMKTALEGSLAEKAKTEIEGQLAEQLKSVNEQIEAVKKLADNAEELKGINKQLEEMKAENAALLKGFNLLQTRVKSTGNGHQYQKGNSFADELGEQLEKRKSDLTNYTKNDRKAFGFEVKTVGNMSASNTTISGTTTFPGPDMLGGVGRKPYESVHIRDFVRVQPIASDSAYVIRDAAGEGGPTAVLPGAAKPQSDRDYVKLIVPVTKIAHYFKLPEEMLSDISWLQNEINAIGVEELLAKEDNLILNQAAGTGLFAGLTTSTNSTAFAAPTELALGVDLANNYDVLVAAWTQLMKLKGKANYVLCNPGDYAKMILTKSSASIGEYVFGAPNIAIPNIFGIPLIPHNEITTDKFLLGDFTKVSIGQREGVSVRFYDQNEDDAIKNMVTVVIEERVTVVADRADRLIYGDFSDARTALETA